VAAAWRPRNESAADLAHEAMARGVIEAAWRCKIVSLSPVLYRLDWALARDGKLIGFGEYKRRGADYATFLLSLAKYQGGIQTARPLCLPFLFFVETPGAGLRWVDLCEHPLPAIEIGGNARGQNGDIEPCMMIPAAWFAPVALRVATVA
jgi:hypothetical protein